MGALRLTVYDLAFRGIDQLIQVDPRELAQHHLSMIFSLALTGLCSWWFGGAPSWIAPAAACGCVLAVFSFVLLRRYQRVFAHTKTQRAEPTPPKLPAPL